MHFCCIRAGVWVRKFVCAEIDMHVGGSGMEHVPTIVPRTGLEPKLCLQFISRNAEANPDTQCSRHPPEGPLCYEAASLVVTAVIENVLAGTAEGNVHSLPQRLSGKVPIPPLPLLSRTHVASSRRIKHTFSMQVWSRIGGQF